MGNKIKWRKDGQPPVHVEANEWAGRIHYDGNNPRVVLRHYLKATMTREDSKGEEVTKTKRCAVEIVVNIQTGLVTIEPLAHNPFDTLIPFTPEELANLPLVIEEAKQYYLSEIVSKEIEADYEQ